MNLSPAQFVEMERIKMQSAVCAIKARIAHHHRQPLDPVVSVK